jgi:hypothetical protein
MSNTKRTTPSSATRAEEGRDARVEAGVDDTVTDVASTPHANPDHDVAEHYEEMLELGAGQRGEGRLP